MGWACVIMGAAGGATYCGIIGAAIGAIMGAAVATGAHAGAQGGAHGGGHVAAANGAAYAGAGAHTGAGAQTAAGRLNHAHGHNGQSRAQQQPLAAGSIATASKISIFFMVLNLLAKQGRDYCFGRVV